MPDNKSQHPKSNSPPDQRNDSLLYGPDDKPLPLTAQEQKLSEKERKESVAHPRGIQAHKRLIAWLLGGATLLGAVVVFVPRPSVAPTDPVDLNNSMSASFTITNVGFIPLRHVTVSIGIARVIVRINGKPGTVEIRGNTTWGTRFTTGAWKEHSLDMDDRFTITPEEVFCPVGQPGQRTWEDGDIAVIVAYRPWFTPFNRERIFRFKTQRQTNGNLYWYSVPPK